MLYTPEERKNIKLTAEQTLIVRDLLVDFSIVGTVKDFKESETAGDYGLAALGIIPLDKLLAVAKGIKKRQEILKPLGPGSTGRTVPNNLNEQLAMKEVMSNITNAKTLKIPMTDSRWPASEGWVKMAKNVNGVEIHFVKNIKTGKVDDFKFK